MQLSFGFGPGENGALSSARVSKLSAVLAAAGRIALYGKVEQEAPDALLARLPRVHIQTYLEDREQFRNHKAPSGAGRREPGAAAGEIRGSLGELLRLAERVGSGEAAPPAGARRLIVRTSLGDRLVSDRARDYLWRVFELPIFEELRGSENELLAAECEAHEGFHLETGSAAFEIFYGELVVTSLVALRYPVVRLRTGWVGAIGRCTCACGAAVTRFLPVVVAETVLRKPPAAARTSRAGADDRVLSSVPMDGIAHRQR
jgi:hypothetical protein